MTKIKLCGLTHVCDVEAANELQPEYIGFVFAPESRRYVSQKQASILRQMLHPDIIAVGVFVREAPESVAGLLNRGIIQAAQLHGGEDEAYIQRLRTLTDRPILKAFRIDTARDIRAAESSSADYVLLDSGAGGTGTSFDWNLALKLQRPCFLAGGLDARGVAEAIRILKPYAVDVSSGIETGQRKDPKKMKEFVCTVRSADKRY